MKKRLLAAVLAGTMVFGLAACGSTTTTEETKQEETKTEEAKTEETKTEEKAEEKKEEALPAAEIQVFIAASLKTAMEEIAKKYNEVQPNIKVTYNADSSGKLLTQIQEGAACDVFFSAAQKQMNTAQEAGLVIDGTRANVLNNQLVVLTRKDSTTAVTGLKDITKAKSMALADGSVPAGKYTRQAMVKAGMLDAVEDVSKITTQEVMDKLGIEISECSNVSKVRDAVKEASCEVGTTYYSDIYGFEDQLKVIEVVSYDLTGDIIYPIAQIKNDEADDAEVKAAKNFIDYVLSDEVAKILQSYYFDTNVTR